MSNTLDQIITDLQASNKNLHHRLQNLSEEDRTSLYAYVSMFDSHASGNLDKHDIEHASNILKHIRHIDAPALRVLNDILHLVDFNHNGKVDHNETSLVMNILMQFSGDDAGDDTTLNHEELHHAYKAIKSFDRNENGSLNKEERGLLTDALKDPSYFKKFGE